jgi:hypothetical protein
MRILSAAALICVVPVACSDIARATVATSRSTRPASFEICSAAVACSPTAREIEPRVFPHRIERLDDLLDACRLFACRFADLDSQGGGVLSRLDHVARRAPMFTHRLCDFLRCLSNLLDRLNHTRCAFGLLGSGAGDLTRLRRRRVNRLDHSASGLELFLRRTGYLLHELR